MEQVGVSDVMEPARVMVASFTLRCPSSPRYKILDEAGERGRASLQLGWGLSGNLEPGAAARSTLSLLGCEHLSLDTPAPYCPGPRCSTSACCFHLPLSGPRSQALNGSQHSSLALRLSKMNEDNLGEQVRSTEREMEQGMHDPQPSILRITSWS